MPPRTRQRGYMEDYTPRRDTLLLLEQVAGILDEYRESLPLTVRQIFYRLVGTVGYPKDERAYRRLGECLVKARRAQIIPFESIRDDGVMGGPPNHFRDAEHFIAAVRRTAANADLDALGPQPRYVEVLCEAAGMLPQLERVASDFSVPVYSSGGFDSLTAKRELVDRLDRARKDAVVLHLGDYDPSGVSIFDVLADDVSAFLKKDAPTQHAVFERVALTANQVAEYSLPTAPPKATDSRSAGWSVTCQLEALPPDLLASLLRTALEVHLDLDIIDQRRAQTDAFRADLLARLPREGDDAA